MKNIVLILILSLLGGCTISAIQADSHRYECPANITLGLKDNIIKRDWQPIATNSTHPFTYNQRSTGHPDKKVFLKEMAIETVSDKIIKPRKPYLIHPITLNHCPQCI